MSISERIATNAKLYCKAMHRNIGDLERDIGVSIGYLSRIKGKAMLPIDKGYAIANWLGVAMDDLVTGKLIKRQRIAELEEELAILKKEVEDES